MNDRFLRQVGEIRGLVLDIALLNENLINLNSEMATQSATRMEAKIYQLLSQVQQVLHAPIDPSDDEPAHVITIQGCYVAVHSSPTLPVGLSAITTDDKENLLEAIEAAVNDTPVNDAELLAEMLRSNR